MRRMFLKSCMLFLMAFSLLFNAFAGQNLDLGRTSLDVPPSNKELLVYNSSTNTWENAFLILQQTVSVAKVGAKYSTIQDAIDSITDNATDKRYIVLIYPGVYTENVVMEEYVSLVGLDHETTEITSASGTTVTAPPGTSDAAIHNLKLTSTPTADGAIVLLMTAGELDVYNSYIKQTSATNGVEGKLIDHNAGELKLENCNLSYDFDGSAGSSAQTVNIIDILASATTSLIMNIIYILSIYRNSMEYFTSSDLQRCNIF